MKILLVEDRGEVAYPLREMLEDDGHKVFLAGNIPQAKTFWKNEKIECLIVDLNMETIGLTEEEIELTHNGLFSGWIWLKKYIFNENSSIKRQTLILTAYLREFSQNFNDFEDIIIITKEVDEEDWYEEILNKVEVVEKRLSK